MYRCRNRINGVSNMSIGIGLDTGGTFTDIVIYDFSRDRVISKGKTPTTKEDLRICINNALDMADEKYLKEAVQISLSTTLATNCCVENKGSRAKLILVGVTDSVMDWIKADSRFGLSAEDVLCIDSHSTYDGTVVDHPDWDKVIEDNAEFFADAQALAVAEVYAHRNGGEIEKRAREVLTERFGVPFVMGNELANDLNVMERGATAWLNARLLNTVRDFTDAVESSLEKRGVKAGRMVVRSDGSLMNMEVVLTYPVKTILSGPAASIVGGNELTEAENCLIVDMGGTTTDVSIVRDKKPFTTKGIKIGKYATQVPGVFIDTFGLGGDSRIVMDSGVPSLEARRVMPLCMASSRYPSSKDDIEKLMDQGKVRLRPLYEALYLVKEPEDPSMYTKDEMEVLDTLREGPIVFGSDIDYLLMPTERLESEGIAMRCGMTPTDFMHIRGDFDAYDREASVLGARYMLKAMADYDDTQDDLVRLTDDVYELVERKVYDNLLRIMLTKDYPKVFKDEPGEQIMELIHDSWDHEGFLELDFRADFTLVGIGAPTHLFLPKVAEKLGCPYIIPRDAEVANALGAVLSDITSEVTLAVSVNTSYNIQGNYLIYLPDGVLGFNKEAEAVEEAKKIALKMAEEDARRMGARGELRFDVSIRSSQLYDKSGSVKSLGTKVTASCSDSHRGRIASL